jgi:hypothetical protein
MVIADDGSAHVNLSGLSVIVSTRRDKTANVIRSGLNVDDRDAPLIGQSSAIEPRIRLAGVLPGEGNKALIFSLSPCYLVTREYLQLLIVVALFLMGRG